MQMGKHLSGYLETKRGTQDSPELELQVFVSHLTWGLGTELEKQRVLLTAEPSLH